jgi:hypothetical protein
MSVGAMLTTDQLRDFMETVQLKTQGVLNISATGYPIEVATLKELTLKISTFFRVNDRVVH